MKILSRLRALSIQDMQIQEDYLPCRVLQDDLTRKTSTYIRSAISGVSITDHAVKHGDSLFIPTNITENSINQGTKNVAH